VEHKDELTPLESRLVECAAAGDELDCAPTGATTAALDQIDDWEERKVRAEVLVDLCTGEVPDRSVHPRRGLRLRGAYITGEVDLSRAQMTQCPLAFHTCDFEEDVVLYQAATADLSFTSCALPSLYGDELNSSGSLYLTETNLRGISLFRAEFRGVVKFSEVRLINPKGRALNAASMSASSVTLNDTHVEGGVALPSDEISGLLGIAFNAVNMSAGSVTLSGTHVKGGVALMGADISDRLHCAEATKLINPEGTALSAASTSASNMLLGGTYVEGEVDLSSADISGDLIFSGATKLINLEGTALRAVSTSASNVLLGGTYVEGEVNLSSADISGQLICGEATELINPKGTALQAVSTSASNVKLYGIHFKGEVDLSSADISGGLFFSEGTKLINHGGYALKAPSCQVGGALFFQLGETAVGKVNLAYAQIGTLHDDLASWPDTYHLVGFTYHSLGGDENLDRRLKWISNSKPFSPQTYTQLAEVYRRSGHEGFARQVSIRREKERGRQPDLSWGLRAWNYFLGLTVAYGYQPWRALVPLVVLFILGWFLFARPPAQHVMVHPSPNIKGPTSAAICHEPYPCFSPPVYVLDTLLPIIDLHQERNWVPARPRPWGVWYEALTWVLIASGWVLTTAVVAGIGSLWRRE
jgi:uncharacterized protein YjbI with pentapeptide repeats